MKKLYLNELDLAEFLEGIRTIVHDELQQSRTAEQHERLLSPDEVCKLFHPPISKVTLYNWTRQGKLFKYTIGRRVFYKQGEVVAALKTLGRFKRG